MDYAFAKMLRRAAAFFVCFLLATPSPARADSTQAAQVLFEEGRKLMAEGDLASACRKFAESQKLDPGAGTLLNVALCYEKRELFASAWDAYTEAASLADRAGRAQWVTRAKDKATALAPELSTLTVVVPENARVDGLEITRDGRKLAVEEWGVKVPVDGGEHTLDASAPGRALWRTRIKAAPKRDALVVTVPVLPASSEAAEKPRPPPLAGSTEKPAPDGSPATTQRVLGIAAGSVGIVALGIGGYFGLRALSKHEDALSDCTPDESRCGERGLADYRTANGAADVSTVAVTVGAVLLIGGVVLYLTASRRATAASLAPRFVLR
jgi:hypothetical protein